MPSPQERNTKRRKRAAAALGIIFVVIGGLAYAATRDDAPGTNGPSDLGLAAPPAPNSDTTSDPDATDTTVTTASTAAKKKVTTTTTVTTGTTPGVGINVDIDIDTASRRPTDPGTEPHNPPATEPATFSVSGSPSGTFQPGNGRAIDLTITNPSGSDLTVTAVTIAVGPSSLPACGAENIVVTRQFSGPVVVPAGATRSLSALGVSEAQWPVVTMPDTGVDQDACQQATFQLTYTGTGTVAS